MSEFEKAARQAGFAIRRFGSVEKIARGEKDGTYNVNEHGWRYACEDAAINVKIVPDAVVTKDLDEVCHEGYLFNRVLTDDEVEAFINDANYRLAYHAGVPGGFFRSAPTIKRTKRRTLIVSRCGLDV